MGRPRWYEGAGVLVAWVAVTTVTGCGGDEEVEAAPEEAASHAAEEPEPEPAVDEPVEDEEVLAVDDDEAGGEADEVELEVDDEAEDGAEAEPEPEPLDVREPGTVVEATYVVEVLEHGFPCPAVELDDGERYAVMGPGFVLDDEGRPAEASYLIDPDGRILWVEPEDWVDVGVPEGEVLAVDGDRVRVESAGALQLGDIMSREPCGDPDDDLLMFGQLERVE